MNGTLTNHGHHGKSQLALLQLALADTYREIALLKGETDDVNFNMLNQLLKTHGDQSSEALLSTELETLCHQLAIQMGKFLWG